MTLDTKGIIQVEHYTDDPAWALRPIALSIVPFQFKPLGALYTSPVDSDHGWRQWCADNEIGLGRFRIVLDVDMSHAVIVDGPDNLPRLAWLRHAHAPTLRDIAFSWMRECDVTAIWLTANGERTTRFSDPYYHLGGWDCETVAILDERIIQTWRLELVKETK